MLMGPANVVVPLLLAAVGLAAVSLLTVHSLMSKAANSGNGGDLDMPPDERLSHWLHGDVRPSAATTAAVACWFAYYIAVAYCIPILVLRWSRKDWIEKAVSC